MGDLSGFGAWYEREYARVIATLTAVAGDVEIAARAADEAFVRAYRHWGRAPVVEVPDGWAYTVALDILRRRARRQRVLGRRWTSAASRLAEWAIFRPEVPEICGALQALPQGQRIALALRYVLELPEAEVAGVMGVTREAASATLVAARRTLLGRLVTNEPRPDLEAELRLVLGHPCLPPPLPPEEIAAKARGLAARRRGFAVAAPVLVLSVAGVALRAFPERADSGQAAPAPPQRPLHATTSSTAEPNATDPPAPPPPASTPSPTAAPSTMAAPLPVVAPASTTTTTTVPPVNPVLASTIEDTDIGNGVGMVEYAGGSWTRCGGCNIATDDDSYYYGYEAGQSYTVRFRGVELKVFAPDDRAGGVAEVRVDGQPASTPTVDFLTSGTPVNGLRWDSGRLPDGVHTVTFTIRPGRPDNVVLFDRAEVYSP
jgi:DNA-directed RNA polymerase specialized sigma24 family protein